MAAGVFRDGADADGARRGPLSAARSGAGDVPTPQHESDGAVRNPLGGGPIQQHTADVGRDRRSTPYDHPVADRYGTDVLANDPHRSRKPRSTEHPVEIGMVVEDAQTGYVGAVVRIEYGRMELEDRHGRRKPFPIGPGYLIDGRPVILTPPRRAAPEVRDAYRVGSGRRSGRERQGGAGQSNLRRGPPRRGTRRAGVGRRPADRGRGRRIPRRGRRPGRDRRGVRASARVVGWVCWSTIWSRDPRRPASPTPCGGDLVAHTLSSSAIPSWTSGRRSSRAGSASRRGRSCRAASTGSTACAGRLAGRTRSRRTSPGHGSGSGTGCGIGMTWSRH